MRNIHWIKAVPSDRSKTRCSFCKTEIDLSNMGASALESHAVGKKHMQYVTASVSASIFFDSEFN